MKSSALLFLLLFSASVVRAQPEILALAPLQVGVDSWYATDPQVLGFVAEGQRTVPLFFFLPNVSPDSRVDGGTIKLGVRSANRDTEFAFSVRVLEAFVAKTPWAGGVTLLRYDRTGPLHVDADWLGIRIGPAFASTRVEARLLGHAAFSTVGATGGLFVGPRDASTGLKAGGTAEVVVRPSTSMRLSGKLSLMTLTAGSNPVWSTWNAAVWLNPDGVLSPRISLGQMSLESDSYGSSTEWLAGFGVVLTPKRRDF
ncbi:MAG: hypothetical protein HKN29_06675 [Rhodothermales bacterium]|nr:hypothetical protein [Rhodothermales bacterium]